MTTTLSSQDLQLKGRLIQQLAWDSQVDATQIGVIVHDGVVTLTGYIDSYAGKLAAERAANRVRGDRAVANDIKVRLRLPRTDTDIATDAARALALRVTIPEGVQAVVHEAHITLTGVVPSLFLKIVAEDAMRHIRGVAAVVNRIQVAALSSAGDVRRDIVKALHREADVNASRIKVAVSGSAVVLTGAVESWHEREAAERAATHAPGITHVENLITVTPAACSSDEDELC